MYTVVALADSWGFTHGGINVFNKLVCEAMADLAKKDVNIMCCAPDISKDEIELAYKSHGLRLLSIASLDFKKPDVIVSTVKESGIDMEHLTWLGHDSYTDELAIGCRSLVSGSKCALIHHMAYGTYYPLLNRDTKITQAKEAHQKEMFRKADYVFANGPLLERNAQDLCKNENKVVKVYPGVEEVPVSDYINKIFNVVSFGRVEKEKDTKRNNTIIKQIYLAVAAWASFSDLYLSNSDETTMKVFGTSDTEAQDDLNKVLGAYANKLHSLATVNYMENRDNLFSELADASVCLVLSAKEGFGMTALEAISAGVPVVVSKSSGFYQALDENDLTGYVLGVDIEASLEEPYFTVNDVENVSRAIYEVYKNIKVYKSKAIRLKEELIKCGFTWEQCSKTILEMVTGTKFKTTSRLSEVTHVREILNAFNRPAFTTKFFCENDLVDFNEALKDTVSIINTGKNIKGHEINKYSVKDISDQQLKMQFSTVVDGIGLLRKVFSKAKENNKIRQCGCMLVTGDYMFGELMDELRLEILLYVRNIAKTYEIDFPFFSILDESIWNKVSRNSKDDLKEMMTESYNRYLQVSTEYQLFR